MGWLMNKNEEQKHDIIDEDLYEEIDEEELYELVQKEKEKALAREREAKENKRSKRPFPKWVFWLIALMLLLNVVALLPQTFSIPAIDFLYKSAKLSLQDDVQTYKQAVVTIETKDSKGTGFSITSDGIILTNYHVVEGEEKVAVAFPEDGLHEAEVKETHPTIDLAVLQADVKDIPFLKLAKETAVQPDQPIRFIGNPLNFNGIANEGKIIDYASLSTWEEKVVMIEAPVYRGNSGSPVLNESGEVIGIIFATLDDEKHGKVGLFYPIHYYYEYTTN
ncbi:putative periplasmic serine endoprotease DegP-like precursor [Virgibacillus dokdonensis]|uniref:Putative periplasmic serine endoprotease DegP-like n=2 Tax=Virgibacillus dokdonensis TaxID=302167 RepID=A0A2K9J133_9BACI|nr:putative periplasmic serine endoprotease DegP-like precursor [Virgibacillus dokdonensis]